MGKRSYKEAFEQAMKSVDSDEEVFVPTSKHKFQYLEPETIAAASGKTIDDFIKDCLESTSPKPRAGKLVPISEEIIHKVLDFTRTLDIHVLAAKVMNLLKNARKSPFLTVNERFEIPENERIGLMLTKSSDQKYLSDFMQATAKAALARGEYENWKKWCRACDPIRFDKMSASQLESKRMLEAGTYYQNVSDRDKSGTLSDKIVTRYAHTGRRWLNYGRILCAGSSKAEGAILALIVCETPKLSSQLDLIQKRFNETHMFVFDKWVAEREPELTAFCVFLEPFAISLHAGKVGSMVRVEKKFKEFLAALPKRRYNFAPIPNEEYVPDDEDEDGSELDEDEDGPEHDEDGVKVPYAQVKIQHDQEDGEPTTGIADAVIGLSVNASNIAPSAESILPAPIGANSPSNRGINGLDETASDAEPSAKQIAVANGGGNIIVSQPTPEHATESNQQQTELIHEPLTHDPNDLVLQTSLQAALNSMDRNAASGEEPWDKFVEYPDT
ncbi:uncharacterized protein EAF02_000111 [Botrytis sinoallii]|uniref:uncharacterized protein n=1 Tax=Botrytis sinoallii TaxID=1463999 RepID=UPI00190244AC|nr:uncharacterized protein EAF02_000111 [Botrytis sinoallii]KAF7892573.1 hypothetical protein EAF02_000111 [Botrytis sinoallii]